jgi:hypothetical protein
MKIMRKRKWKSRGGVNQNMHEYKCKQGEEGIWDYNFYIYLGNGEGNS